MARRTVFLSYQRSSSSIYARYFSEKMREWKFDVFLDVEDIDQGRFDEIVEREIASRDYFVIILTPTTLESEWVVREVEAALRHRRNIISILMDDFSFEHLPPSIAPLKYYHGIPYIHAYSEGFFDKLKKALTRDVSTQPHKLPTVAGYMTRLQQRRARRRWIGTAALVIPILVLLLAVVVLLLNQDDQPTATPEEADLPTSTAAETLDQATPSNAALRLVYNDTYLYVLNISSHSQNISSLRFVQERSSADDLLFEASDWLNQFYPSGRGSIYSLPPNGCYQIFRINIDNPASPEGCGQRYGWLARFGSRPFWTAADPNNPIFKVYQGNTLLAECEFAAGVCEFSLP